MGASYNGVSRAIELLAYFGRGAMRPHLAEDFCIFSRPIVH